MIKVYGDHIRRYEKNISKNAWEQFWEECLILDNGIEQWSQLTKNKLNQVVIKILAQAKYIDTTKSKRITPPYLHPDAVKLIKTHHPQILKAMEFNQ